MLDIEISVSTYNDSVVEKIIIKNHWNEKSKITVSIDGKECTVVASELIEAVTKAKRGD